MAHRPPACSSHLQLPPFHVQQPPACQACVAVPPRQCASCWSVGSVGSHVVVRRPLRLLLPEGPRRGPSLQHCPSLTAAGGVAAGGSLTEARGRKQGAAHSCRTERRAPLQRPTPANRRTWHITYVCCIAPACAPSAKAAKGNLTCVWVRRVSACSGLNGALQIGGPSGPSKSISASVVHVPACRHALDYRYGTVTAQRVSSATHSNLIPVQDP